MPRHPNQQLSPSTDQYSPTIQGAATPVAKEKPSGADSRRPSRAVASAGAVCLGALIILEPLVIDTTPGLQIFQAVSIIWVWGLFMFGGTSDRQSGRM